MILRRRPGLDPGRPLFGSTLPLWLKLAYTLFMVVWVPMYWASYGLQNFLWICDLANFLILVALWTESAILVSSQAVAVLVLQGLWMADVAGRLLLGFHPLGGTEYMFDPAKPLALRGLSLFHLAIPLLLLWLIHRLGYHRRGWKLQTLILWIQLPLTYWITDPAANINWLWKPFDVEPPLVPAPWALPVAMLAIPLVIYLPTHAALARWKGGGKAGRG